MKDFTEQNFSLQNRKFYSFFEALLRLFNEHYFVPENIFCRFLTKSAKIIRVTCL